MKELYILAYNNSVYIGDFMWLNHYFRINQAYPLHGYVTSGSFLCQEAIEIMFAFGST
uniref:Uncharacterized protein n=1 Tax=Anguilla anguilla TaxID=7936 RepID=A0A0E9PA76_ANGAN